MTTWNLPIHSKHRTTMNESLFATQLCSQYLLICCAVTIVFGTDGDALCLNEHFIYSVPLWPSDTRTKYDEKEALSHTGI